MLKKILIGLSINISFLLANGLATQPKDLSNLEMVKNLDKTKEEFKNSKFNDFQKFSENKSSYNQQLDMFDSMFQGSNFINKNESFEIVNDLQKAMDYDSKPRHFMIYLFSESVPKNSVLNFLLDIDILKSNGFNIMTKQYMVGYPTDYKQYMFDWRTKIEEYPDKYRIQVTNSFAMKLDPRFFTVYDIKTVPAILYAVCNSDIPDVEHCKVNYLIHGDTPLVSFLDKISNNEINKEKKAVFMDMKRVLNANQIYKPKNLILSESKEVEKNEKK